MIRIFHVVRWFIAPIVFLTLVIYWIFWAVLAAPLVLLDSVFGWTRNRYAKEPPEWGVIADSNDKIFDRRADVSKLIGCNTRNVRYRWSIFSDALERFGKSGKAVGALDFGAGSLRDSYEMARRGYRVTAMDLNRDKMLLHSGEYDWSGAEGRIKLVEGPIDNLGAMTFDVITAFDVIEHTENPEAIIGGLHDHLADDGVLLVSVPNGRTFYERYARIQVAVMPRLGATFVPGETHLTFRTPSEWRRTFEGCGFRVSSHDMAIGFLVNDACHTAFRVPLLSFVCPVLGGILRFLGIRFDQERFIRSFYPRWIVEHVDLVDRALKPVLREMFGWNLFVLERSVSDRAAAGTPVITASERE